MKILLLIVVLGLIGFVLVHYAQTYYEHPSSCPDGSTYVRKVSGGGWVATDATDPFGSCVSNSDINAALNR